VLPFLTAPFENAGSQARCLRNCGDYGLTQRVFDFFARKKNKCLTIRLAQHLWRGCKNGLNWIPPANT